MDLSRVVANPSSRCVDGNEFLAASEFEREDLLKDEQPKEDPGERNQCPGVKHGLSNLLFAFKLLSKVT